MRACIYLYPVPTPTPGPRPRPICIGTDTLRLKAGRTQAGEDPQGASQKPRPQLTWGF